MFCFKCLVGRNSFLLLQSEVLKVVRVMYVENNSWFEIVQVFPDNWEFANSARIAACKSSIRIFHAILECTVEYDVFYTTMNARK